jgi:hypothetical protein
MNRRKNLSRLRKAYLARLREKQLKYLLSLCEDLNRSAASVGEIREFYGEALPDHVCGVLMDALASLTMARLHIRDECERLKGGDDEPR